jgi:predicted esterase
MASLVDQLLRDPHGNASTVWGGSPLAQAKMVMVLLHGRGGSAQDMLALAEVIDCTRCASIALQAHGSSWYPYSFLEPLERNEPWLSSALLSVGRSLAELDDQGFPSKRVALLGFSQGACLALEYAARNPRRYGALIGLSGGLIGPPGTDWHYPGSLEDTPVFLGCSDADPHIPKARVDESAVVLEELGGRVTKCLYPRMGHTVNQDEIDVVKAMLDDVLE